MDIERSKKKIKVFLAIFIITNLVLQTLLFVYLDTSRTMLIIFIMWSPGISAIITSLIFERNLRGFGWGWGKWRWQALSYIFPAVCALIVYGIAWLSGIGDVSTDMFAKIRKTDTFIAALGITLSLNFLKAGIAATGEEIGWRGFFIAELSKVTTFTKSSFIIGLIWAVWHVPGILLFRYNAGTHPAFAIPCFIIMIVSGTFVMNWVRLKSGSLWTGAIFHTCHNLFIQSVFDLMTVEKEFTKYFTTEFGIGMAAVYAITAYYFWRRRGEVEQEKVKV